MPFGIEVEFEHAACNGDRLHQLADRMRDYGRVIDDQSLRGSGGEFVTSVLNNYRGATDFMRMFMHEFNNVMGVSLAEASSPRTSIHIHYSNTVISTAVDVADPPRVSSLFSDLALLEQILLGGFPSRRMNNYAVPEEYTKILMGVVNAVHNGMSLGDAIGTLGDKYSAMNVRNMTQTPRRRTVEMRILPSTITFEEFSAVIYLFTVLRPGSRTAFPFVYGVRKHAPEVETYKELLEWFKTIPEEEWDDNDSWSALSEMARFVSSGSDSFSSIPLMLSWLCHEELSHHMFRIRAMREM